MSITSLIGHLTNAETTLTVTTDTACVPSALLGPSSDRWGVIAEVLSNSIFYTCTWVQKSGAP